jgi:eukaryotic-like serine/threonine-protein kinase
MMENNEKCIFCGEMHKRGAKFCPKTGKQIPLKGRSQGESPAPSARQKIAQPTLIMNNEKSFTQPIQIPKSPGTIAGKPQPGQCPLCSGIHKKGAKFCPKTGTPIFFRECPFCQCEVILRKPDARFCPHCGGNLVVLACPYEGCGTPLPSSKPFCEKCKRKITYCLFCKSSNDVSAAKCAKCQTPLPAVTGEWLTFKGNPTRTGLSGETLEFPLLLKWTFPDSDKKTSRITGSPIIWRGTIYIGDHNGNLNALNQYDGTPKWTRPIKSPIISTPAIYDGMLYLASMEGKVYAIDANNGKILWVYPKKREEKIAPVDAPLLVDRERVYVAALGGEVMALRRDSGDPAWSVKKAAGPTIDTGSGVAPALFGEILIVASPAGFVYGFGRDSGTTLWQFPKEKALSTEICSTPAVSEGIVYVADRAGRLYALKGDTGEDTWHFSTSIEGIITSSLSLGGGYIFVGTWSEIFYCLDKNAGGIRWRFKNEKIATWDSISSTPLVLESGIVLFGSSSGFIYALDREGKELWTYRLDSEIVSSPAVSDGFLYVPSSEGFLHAFSARTAQKG